MRTLPCPPAGLIPKVSVCLFLMVIHGLAHFTPACASVDGVIAYCYQPVSGSDLTKAIYTINADGTGNTKLIQAQMGLNAPDWSPDATKIVAYGYPSASTWSVFKMDADGTNLTRLSSLENVWDNSPMWSPGGSKIVFTRLFTSDYHEEIWIMDADGGNQHSIGLEGGGAVWSPDSSKFAYHSSRAGNIDIYVCDVDGTGEERLTFSAGADIQPAWSPDGERIAFVTNRDGNYEIYVMAANGADVQRLTNNVSLENSPDWSPDGTLIAFDSDLSNPAADHWEIYIMGANGEGVTRVTYTPSNATAISPDWRPAGSPTAVGKVTWGGLKRLFKR